jgi:purine-binding chemotaxis protein CheW
MSEEELEKGSRQLLTFDIGNVEYGLLSSSVSSIERVPEIIHVPLSSDAFEGLCSIGGRILPVVNVGQRLRDPNSKIDKQRARIVITAIEGIEYGLLVDKVNLIIDVDRDDIDEVNDANDDECVEFVAKYEGKIIQALDEKQIISNVGAMTIANNLSGNISTNTDTSADSTSSDDSDHNSAIVLRFKLADESYALNINEVREIIFVPEKITPIPNSAHYVEGMITLRDDVIWALDLRNYYNLDAKREARNRILIIETKEGLLGLMVDEVEAVLTIDLANTEDAPTLINEKDYISKIIKFNGNELVSLINPDLVKNLVLEFAAAKSSSEELKAALSESTNENNEDDIEDERDQTELVIFNMAENEYAFAIESVQEIIKVENITPVPETASYVDGITNLRGNVLPVVSLRKRYGLEENTDEDQQIIVIDHKNLSYGVKVDKVSEVSFVNNKLINAIEDDENYTDVINFTEDKRMVMNFRIDSIISATELSMAIK